MDRGVDIVAVSFELKLVNQKFPEKSVVMSTEAPLGITERGAERKIEGRRCCSKDMATKMA